jgi:hypothetical protein
VVVVAQLVSAQEEQYLHQGAPSRLDYIKRALQVRVWSGYGMIRTRVIITIVPQNRPPSPHIAPGLPPRPLSCHSLCSSATLWRKSGVNLDLCPQK